MPQMSWSRNMDDISRCRLAAFEAAACLAAQGIAVERVVLLDSFAPGSAALATVLEVGEAPGLPVAVAGALAQGWKPAGPLPPTPADLPEAEAILRTPTTGATR